MHGFCTFFPGFIIWNKDVEFCRKSICTKIHEYTRFRIENKQHRILKSIMMMSYQCKANRQSVYGRHTYIWIYPKIKTRPVNFIRQVIDFVKT